MPNKKLTAEEMLSKYTGLTVNDEDAYIIHTKTEYVLRAIESFATQELTEVKAEIERLQSELTQLKTSKE